MNIEIANETYDEKRDCPNGDCDAAVARVQATSKLDDLADCRWLNVASREPSLRSWMGPAVDTSAPPVRSATRALSSAWSMWVCTGITASRTTKPKMIR